MSLVFILTALVNAPDLPDILRGMLTPTLPAGSNLVAIGLIGTTVVPYNRFLHANAVQEKWSADNDLENNLRESRWGCWSCWLPSVGER